MVEWLNGLGCTDLVKRKRGEGRRRVRERGGFGVWVSFRSVGRCVYLDVFFLASLRYLFSSSSRSLLMTFSHARSSEITKESERLRAGSNPAFELAGLVLSFIIIIPF